MSELRDLTAAMRAFDKRVASVEDCMVVLVRNSQQEAEWRHLQKTQAMITEGLRDEAERAMKQLQEAVGAISHKLAEFHERQDNAAATRLADVRELRERVRQLESDRPDDETTKP